MKTLRLSHDGDTMTFTTVTGKTSVYAASKRFHNTIKKKQQATGLKTPPLYAAPSGLTVLKNPLKTAESFIQENIPNANYRLFPVFKTESGKEVYSNGTLIVRFKPGVKKSDVNRISKNYGAKLERELNPDPEAGYDSPQIYLLRYGGSNKIFLDELSKFNEDDRVEYAYPNLINAIEYEDAGEADNPNFNPNQKPLLSALGVLDAWNALDSLTTKYPGVKIAVLDEGILKEHTDLNGRVVERYDELGIGLNCPATANSHGTAMAGIIGAVNNKLAIVGVASGALLCDVRVSYTDSWGNRQSEEAKIISGIYKAVNTWKARVINLSWSHEFTLGIRDAIRDVVKNKKVIVCCAAGNYKAGESTTMKFPAYMSTAYDVISVGACDINGALITLTNPAQNNWGSCNIINGEKPTVLAPGLSIATLALSNGVDLNFNGTSAATAFISGICALMATVDPNVTPGAVKTRLKNSTGQGAGQMASAKTALADTIASV